MLHYAVFFFVIAIFVFAHLLFEHFFHFLGPALAIFVQQVGPSHLSRDDLITVRMIDILLEKFHILLSLPVLLLEEALPIVFVPNFVGL